MTPGLHFGVPMAEYLAIDALSATPLRRSYDECPRAGWFASRLNPNRPPRDATDDMDIGTIAHELLLEQSASRLVVIDPKDHPAEKTGAIPAGWTNKSIRAARDAARAQGKCPVFPETYAAIQAMLLETAKYLDSIRTNEPAIWRMMEPDGGDSEVVGVWEDDGILCKIRFDRLAKDHRVFLDYKTGKVSVEPDNWGRVKLREHAFDAAFYRRGLQALTGIDADVVFLAQETEAPYLCSMPGLDPAWLAIMGAKVDAALEQWRACVVSGVWPGYPARVSYPDLPPWVGSEFEAQVAQAGNVLDYGKLTGRPSIEEMVR